MKPEIDNSIFSETECLSKEALIRYRDNKMNQTQKHAVERHLTDCSLCSDALEGFALIGSVDLSDETAMQVNELVHSEKGTVLNWKYLSIAASITLVCILSYFTYTQFIQVNDEKIAVAEPLNIQQDKSVDDIEKPVATYSEQPESEIESVKQKAPESFQIAESRDKEFTDALVAEDVDVYDQKLSDEFTSESMSGGSRISAIETEEIAEADFGVSDEVKSGVSAKPYVSNITYVDNLKVIDYSEKESGKGSSELSKSVPSAYQNKKQMNAVQKDQLASEVAKPRKVEYLHMLAEPIAMYNEGRYELAVSRFNEILEINNKDENALFYKGMSLYHLKEYNRAIQSLNGVSGVAARPFGEESKFYIAKSYLNLGNKSKAIKMFREIVAKKGFYAEKANEELELLN